MKKLNIFSPYFIEHKRYTMASFFYVVSTVHCAAVSFNVTWRFSFTVVSTAAMALVSLLGVPDQLEESLLQN